MVETGDALLLITGVALVGAGAYLFLMPTPTPSPTVTPTPSPKPTPTPTVATPKLAVSPTTIIIDGEGSYSPNAITFNGSGFTPLNTVVIYDNNSINVATYVVAVQGTFSDTLGLGNNNLSNYSPSYSQGSFVAYDNGTDTYSNSVSVLYSQSTTVPVFNPTVSLTGMTVLVTATITGIYNNIVINWGDGILIPDTTTITPTNWNGTGTLANHSYTLAGTYNIVITVNYPGGSFFITNTRVIS